jgi:Trypsin-like peptidase domain/Effector-associated domain 1
MSSNDPLSQGSARAAWRETLARKYPYPDDARIFVSDVGLDPIRIAFNNRADVTWFKILEEARNQGGDWVRAVLDHALKQFPSDEGLQRLRDGAELHYAEGPNVSSLVWHNQKKQTYERLIGQRSSLVHVSFLEIGLRRARAVARIKYRDGSLATGFLIPGDLLVTNHHVLKQAADAEGATAQFNHQKTADGRDSEMDELPLDPGAFFTTSAVEDCTIVKVSGEPSARWGAIELGPGLIHVDDRVNVIQHPGGDQKQLSFFHNLVMFVGEGRVQYLTDTLPGSSGSPVFDKEWNLVALHHSGGWISEPGSKETFFRNEGIHVERVAELLRTAR